MRRTLRLEPLADRITPAAVAGTPGDDIFLLYGVSPTYAVVERYGGGGRGMAVIDRELTIDAGGGNDQLWVLGLPSVGVKFVGGAGVDTVRLFNLPSANATAAGPWNEVRGANGGAAVGLDAASVEAIQISGTDAPDVYRVAAEALRVPLHIDPRGGWDTLVAGGFTAATIGTAGGVGNVGSLTFPEATLEGLFLLGTAGNDTLRVAPNVTRSVYLGGLGGDDTIYGGLGNDHLDGGAGNDGLFGGRGTNRFDGGAGADRFLDWTTGANLITDAETGDAVVRFTPGTAGNRELNALPQDWREDEITTVDTALGNLHRLTGNTKLLKTADGRAMGFERWSAVGLPNGGPVLGWNTNGVLSVTSNAFAGEPLKVWAAVYHEFAHNWDDPAENPLIPAFRSLSGWTATPPADTAGYDASDPAQSGGQVWFFRTSDGFARNYGRLGGPNEDYATTWESVFTLHFHGVLPTIEGTANVLVPAKAANVWGLVDSLK